MNYLDRTFLPRIDLAREADFAIGALTVRPSRREIEGDGVCRVLQRRVMQVLVALAHPSAEVVSQDELISRCWGGLAVGEDAVGRCIGQLRRLAEAWPNPPFEITTIAGVGYRLEPVSRAARGTAEAAASPRGLGANLPRGPPTRLAIAGAAAVLLALALWLGHGLVPAPVAPASKLAVLPFEPLTSSAAERSFAVDLADDLQSALSMSQIPVVSRGDAGTLRGADQARKLKALGVRLLFDGTVTTERDTLRARVHLDDPGQHVTLWSIDIAGPASNPDALEAQVGARAIVVLNCAALALRPTRGLSDPQALALYLHACDLFEEKGWGNDSRAMYGSLDAFRQVTVRAPGFAPGHSALAKYLAYYRHLLPTEAQAAAESEREARLALTIDPKDSDAFIALSLLRSVSDYAGRERLTDQALAANPSSAHANLLKAQLLFDVGRFGEAMTYLDRAAAANPLSLGATRDVQLVASGQTVEGNAELERLDRLWPHSGQLWFERMQIYGMERRWDEGLALLDDRQSWPQGFSDTDIQMIRTSTLAEKTRTAAAIAKARRIFLTAPAREQEALQGRILLLADLGLADDAFRLADRYSRAGMTSFSGPRFLFDSGPSALRRDPRFIAFAAKLGLVDYWRATGKWPDFCAEPGLPYSCQREAERLASAPRR